MRLSERIVATKGKSTGFDYLRILLSLAVVAWHTILVCYGPSAEAPIWRGPFRPVVFFIIPAFFALSGFLVAGSLQRVMNIRVFLTLRALRIFPALCCEVLISALLIGPSLTDRTAEAYFSDPQFRAYFLNILGDIHFYLPGVFAGNPSDKVNEQLWTIPLELKCYLLLSACYVLGIANRARLFVLVAAAINLVLCYNNIAAFGASTELASPTGWGVIMCFVWGCALYLNRTRVPYSGALCAVAAVAWLAVIWTPATVGLAPLPIAYIVLYLGLQNPHKIRLIAASDYSYGVYLYGFPIQQAVYALLPAGRVWYANLVLSLVVVGICAWASWVFIEAPILARKGRATRFVDGAFKSLEARLAKVAKIRQPRLP